MRNEDESFMRLALDQARLALTNNWIPVGAVFVKNGRVIAHGRKTGMSHPLFDHAEHNGCYQTLWNSDGPRNLYGCTVYSTLEPCLMCLSMLLTTHVSRIVFGLSDPYGGSVKLLAHPLLLPPRFQNELPLVEGGLLAEESRQLLRQFFVTNKHSGSKNWSDKNNPLVKLAMTAA